MNRLCRPSLARCWTYRFVLAFSFSIVYQRYDDKKDLVREEALAVWTAYQRADFLPENERQLAKNEIHRYVNLHISIPFSAEEYQQEHKKALRAVLLETRSYSSQSLVDGNRKCSKQWQSQLRYRLYVY